MIIRGTLEKVHQAHKALQGVGVVLDKMDFEEKDPIETATAIAEMVQQGLWDIVSNLQTVCRTRIYDSCHHLVVCFRYGYLIRRY